MGNKKELSQYPDQIINIWDLNRHMSSFRQILQNLPLQV